MVTHTNRLLLNTHDRIGNYVRISESVQKTTNERLLFLLFIFILSHKTTKTKKEYNQKAQRREPKCQVEVVFDFITRQEQKKEEKIGTTGGGGGSDKKNSVDEVFVFYIYISNSSFRVRYSPSPDLDCSPRNRHSRDYYT